MSAVDKSATVVWRAVKVGGSEEIDAVIAPTITANEIGDGHQFEQGYAGVRQLRELAAGGFPRPLWCKGAEVHLVDHLSLEAYTWPRLIGPLECIGLDDLGRTMRSIGLKSGGGIRI